MKVHEVTEADVERELAKLEKQIKNFRIIGAGSNGSFSMGFVIGEDQADTSAESDA